MLWLAAGSNSFENSKSLIVGKMVSGRYRSDYLCRHWTPTNKMGFCLADTCYEVIGDLVHMLGACPALQSVRARLFKFWMDRSAATPALHSFISEIACATPHNLTKFVLDPSQFPAILAIWKSLGQNIMNHTYYLTRTFAYYMHREKMLSLGRWPGDPGRKAKLVTKIRKVQTTILNSHDQITHFSVAGTTDDRGQPTLVLSHNSMTTLSTATHTQTTHSTHVPGLVTRVGYQHHVPHTADPTAHHGAGGRDWDTGDGGRDVTALTGLSSNVPIYLSSSAHSVSTNLQKSGLMVV